MTRTKRNTLITFLLSLFWIGAGQFHNGHLKRGIIILSSFQLLLIAGFGWFFATFVGFAITLSLLAGIHLYSVAESVTVARRQKKIDRRVYQRWYVYLFVLILAFLPGHLMLYQSLTRYQPFGQPSGSMEPTLSQGDLVLCDTRYYENRPIMVNDLVVCRFPRVYDNGFYLRRCIGLSGQTVEIRDRIVYVDGISIAVPGFALGSRYPIRAKGEPFPSIFPPGAGNLDNYGPVIVPEAYVFLLGDNIANTLDSREWGFVSVKMLHAKSLYVYWSWDWNRIGQLL